MRFSKAGATASSVSKHALSKAVEYPCDVRGEGQHRAKEVRVGSPRQKF